MSTTSQQRTARLVERELGIPSVGDGDAWLDRTSRDIGGIALSGGGIRSATFNLGLLQGLNRLGLLGAFDYLSTVSGGGYVGGFWSRWNSRDELPPEEAGQVFPARDEDDGEEAPSIRHLREFSNFLIPRLGLLTIDTGRALVAVLSSTVPALAAAVALVFLAVGAWLGAAFLLFGIQPVPPGGTTEWLTVSFVVIALGTALFLPVGEQMMPRAVRRSVDRWYVVAALVATAATALNWSLVVRGTDWLAGMWSVDQLVPMVRRLPAAGEWRYVLSPAAAFLGGALALVVLRLLGSRWMRTLHGRIVRDAFDRAQSRLLLYAAIWAVAGAFWVAAVLVSRDALNLPPLRILAGAAAVFGAAFTWAQRIASRQPARPSKSAFFMRLKPLLPQVLAYASISLLVVWVMGVIALAAAGPRPAASLWWIAGGAAGVTVLTLFLFNPNEVGLHSFYKGRLVRAYLGASNPAGGNVTVEHELDDAAMDTLTGRPVHLVCCAANDLSDAAELDNLHRGAESAVLSRVGISVGEDWASWKALGHRVHTLGSAMTASGAALNSLMGSKSIALGPGVTFLAAALNLRLGLWVFNPRHVRRAVPRAHGSAGAGAPSRPKTPLPLDIPVYVEDEDAPRRSAWRALRPVGVSFYRELLGMARTRARYVHLSDGGHFENMGVYELVRRHCRFIVASDCGADPSVSFDDFGNLVRKVRQDFGVDIQVNLDPLRPGPDGLARQYMVAGDVHYPNGDTGVLLLFKPALTGREPADVQQYRTRNLAFPHESTGDQFYDEAQWESYRRLGEHAALTAFERVLGGLGECPGELRRAEVFARARFEWLPVPAGYEARAVRIADSMAQLDGALRQPGCEVLFCQVYKEVRELSGAAPLRWRAVPDPAPGDGGASAFSVTLDVVRRALRFMDEVYHSEDLERNQAHPVYLGLMNYFARWTHAPLFRTWWPLAKALHPQPFCRFMEQQFGLEAVGAPGLHEPPYRARLQRGGTGFSWTCWENENGPRAAGDGRDVLSYGLQVFGRGGVTHGMQAAHILCRTAPGLVAWDAADFYVPPGLWGCGIGADFLRRLKDVRSTSFLDGSPPPGTCHLLVRITCGPARGVVEKKRIADDVGMYRAAGFTEAVRDKDTGVLRYGDGSVLRPDDHPEVPREWWAVDARWMIRVRRARRTGESQGGVGRLRRTPGRSLLPR